MHMIKVTNTNITTVLMQGKHHKKCSYVEVPEVLMGGRFHRLSSLRFIARGNDVSRVLIHRLSLIRVLLKPV